MSDRDLIRKAVDGLPDERLSELLAFIRQLGDAPAAPPRYADLLDLAADLPDAPPDLAAQHDHYLYGTPKR